MKFQEGDARRFAHLFGVRKVYAKLTNILRAQNNRKLASKWPKQGCAKCFAHSFRLRQLCVKYLHNFLKKTLSESSSDIYGNIRKVGKFQVRTVYAVFS